MENGASLGDILSAAMNKHKHKDVNMEKIANFYRAAKDIGWSTLEVIGALSAEQLAALEEHILESVKFKTCQRVKLFSPYGRNNGSDLIWEQNPVSCIKLVRSCSQGTLFGLKESKDFCEGHGTLDVNPDELQRLISLFGRGALDLF